MGQKTKMIVDKDFKLADIDKRAIEALIETWNMERNLKIKENEKYTL